MNYSRQREMILQTVLQNPIHPTADQVYQQLRREDPKISLGTVYRNLNFLAEMGKIKKISMPVGSDRFDGRLDEHFHAVCGCCGQVFDVEWQAPDQLDARVLAEGFQVRERHLLLTGLCRSCREQEAV